jgi:hypothetical protein
VTALLNRSRILKSNASLSAVVLAVALGQQQEVLEPCMVAVAVALVEQS